MFAVAVVLLGLIAHSIAAVCSNTIPPLKHARSMHLRSVILLHLYVQLDHLHPRDPPCSRCLISLSQPGRLRTSIQQLQKLKFDPISRRKLPFQILSHPLQLLHIQSMHLPNLLHSRLFHLTTHLHRPPHHNINRHPIRRESPISTPKALPI